MTKIKMIAAAALAVAAVGCSPLQRTPYGTYAPKAEAEALTQQYQERRQREQAEREDAYAKYSDIGPDLSSIRGGNNPAQGGATTTMLRTANIQLGRTLNAIKGLPGQDQQATRACGSYAYSYRAAANAANDYNNARYVETVGNAAYTYCGRMAAELGMRTPSRTVYLSTW
ncbi:hypothetical protein [Burkholderia cenocepacia]|uniref:hypothetical protein n=1 Tax=Burkholderia cenocepacia TaxID=95486 RepID=UPI002864DA25|nr:hypothetical protein [Burkholderia cenocepacia]MDR8054193.1 hypothetical protein [Burkholderia cenocepacia]MDR8064636.1 hypothetical protein [Burkholderia cenocepacia]